MDLPSKLLVALSSMKSGKLVSQLIEWSIDFAMRYCSFLSVIPYDWDKHKGQISLKVNSLSYIKWSIVRVIFTIHSGLIWYNFTRSVSSKDSFGEITVVFFAAAAYSIPTIVQFMFHQNLSEFAQFFNGNMNFFKDFEEKYWKPNSPPFGKFLELLIACCILASVTQPYFIHMIYFIRPLSKMFFFSSYFLNENSSYSLVVLAVFPSLWSCLIGWGTTMIISISFVHFVYTFVFVTKQVVANYASSQTLDVLRTPRAAFSTYRCLQLVTMRANLVFRSTLLVMVDLLMSLTVVANCMMIVYHSTLVFTAFIVFGTYSSVCTVSLLVLYVKLGQFDETSKKFVRSWKFNINYTPVEKQLWVKQFKSCRLNRMHMGNVGCFMKPTSIRIVGKIIFYTTKFLMIMRHRTDV